MSGFDWDRLPYEIKWAADRAGVLLELLDPPGVAGEDYDVDVTAIPADGQMRIVHPPSGTLVCEVPIGRLRRHDPALVRESIAALPDDAYAEAVAAHDAGQLTVDAPPDTDFVLVFIRGEPFMAIHRRAVVPGWPDE